MFVPFDSLPEESKIWIYQSNRKFSDEEIQEIEKAIAKYLEPDLHFTYNRKAVLERTKRGKLKQFQSVI